MDNFRILQLNTRSITPKRDLIDIYLIKNNIDAAMFSETWLLNDHKIKFKNYTFITQNRSDGYGGVAILLRNDIKITKLEKNDFKPLESIEVEINLNGKPFNLISIYIPPKTRPRKIKTPFQKLLDKYKNNRNVIIGGDINARNSLWELNSKNNQKGEIISQIITESNLTTLNDGSHTYQKNAITSAIDITLASANISSKSEWHTDENLASDHLAIIIEIESLYIRQQNIVKITNHKKIIESIEQLNTTTSNLFEFETLLKNIIGKYTTHINDKNKSHIPKYWWNEKIHRLWIVKNFKQTLFNKTKNLYLAVEARKSSNTLKNEIRKAKKIAWEQYLKGITSTINSKELWQKLNKIRNNRTKNNSLNDITNVADFMNLNFPIC